MALKPRATVDLGAPLVMAPCKAVAVSGVAPISVAGMAVKQVTAPLPQETSIALAMAKKPSLGTLVDQPAMGTRPTEQDGGPWATRRPPSPSVASDIQPAPPSAVLPADGATLQPPRGLDMRDAGLMAPGRFTVSDGGLFAPGDGDRQAALLGNAPLADLTELRRIVAINDKILNPMFARHSNQDTPPHIDGLYWLPQEKVTDEMRQLLTAEPKYPRNYPVPRSAQLPICCWVDRQGLTGIPTPFALNQLGLKDDTYPNLWRGIFATVPRQVRPYGRKGHPHPWAFELPLRDDDQRLVIDSFQQQLLRNDCIGVEVVPCGKGKTAMALKAISDVLTWAHLARLDRAREQVEESVKPRDEPAPSDGWLTAIRRADMCDEDGLHLDPALRQRRAVLRARSALVICPNDDLVGQWVSEARRFWSGGQVETLGGKARKWPPQRRPGGRSGGATATSSASRREAELTDLQSYTPKECEPGDLYDVPLVVATVQMLLSRFKGWTRRRLKRFMAQFAIVTCDETHHMVAEAYLQLFQVIPWERILAVTATLRRRDGRDRLFEWYLGRVFVKIELPPAPWVNVTLMLYHEGVRQEHFYKEGFFKDKYNNHQMELDLLNDAKRNAYLVALALNLADERRRLRPCTIPGGPPQKQGPSPWLHHARTPLPDSVHARIGSFLTVPDLRTRLCQVSREARRVYNRRHIMVFVKQRTHAHVVQLMIRAQGRGLVSCSLLLGEMKDEDKASAKLAQIIVATKDMCQEGFNLPSLDTEVLGCPLGEIEQASGRFLRDSDFKFPVHIVDLVDTFGAFGSRAQCRLYQYAHELGFTCRYRHIRPWKDTPVAVAAR